MRRTKGCVTAILGLGIAGIVSCSLLIVFVFVFPLPVRNVLILGLDSRGPEGAVARSDAILVVGMPQGTAQLGLLSIPRDLFIPAPGFGLQRVNVIHVLGEQEAEGGGMRLAAESIAAAFDMPIDRVIRLDFRAFEAIVDALGGVNVYVERTITDFQFPTDDFGTQTVTFNEGWMHMDGATALKYARTRSMDDDYRRAARQQAVFRAVAVRLINPLTWPAVLRAWGEYVQTDISVGDLLLLAPSVLLRSGSVEQLVIDRDYIVPGPGGAQPNYERLNPFLDRYFRSLTR